MSNFNIHIQELLSEKSAILSRLPINYISTDSRTIGENSMFIPLRGANFDGHDYIASLIKSKSEVIAVSEYDTGEIKQLDLLEHHHLERIIRVDNCLSFYHKLAQLYLKKIQPITVAITGSSGKTTTKELLKAVLSQKYQVHASEANFNNEIGVPKTILAMPETSELLILEMGMRALGEIDVLSQIVEPDISIITNIGTAHIERLGSRENIRQAKLEILNGMNPASDYRWFYADEGLAAFVSSDKRYSTLVKEKNIQLEIFEPNYNYKVRALMSTGLALDIGVVVQLAMKLGLGDTEITSGLLQYNPGAGRGQIVESSSGGIVIDETYNASIEAVYNSVAAIKKQYPGKRLIVILGTIAESKQGLVDSLFQDLEDDKAIELWDVRDLANKDVASRLDQELKKDTVALLKASRVHKLEEVFHHSSKIDF